MSAKHTQGPWKRGVTSPKIYGADGEPVARAWHDRDAIEREANARLIAAAPELLEALEAAETALIKDMEDPEGFNWEQSGLLPKIRAAIAKARQ